MNTSKIKSVAAAITIFVISGQTANAAVLRGGVQVRNWWRVDGKELGTFETS